MPLRLAVLASLTGSLFEAMIKQQLPVQLMVADRQCRALEIADKAGIPYEFLPRTFGRTFDREEYTRAMMMLFRAYGIDLVAMAGFMTVFAPAMFAFKRARQELLRIIAADQVPDRPNRVEPRARKRRPKSYQLLTHPRHLMVVSPSRALK